VTRYDSTTMSVYHECQNESGLLRYGHSKDHRPDLAQFKVMLSALDPLGLPLTCQLVNGKRADDPLYDKTVETFCYHQFLAIGDSKIGSMKTRTHLASQGSYYLCPFRKPAAKQITRLTWLLILALRVMILLEFRIRRQLAQCQQSIVGLNPAPKTQAQILSLRNLPDDIYSRLGQSQPKPLFNLRE